jgi:muramoyltetrapeptide carboxypeptidase
MFEKIKKGDTVGIIAPSSKIDEDDLEAINNSVLLMESTGLKVKFAKNVFKKTLGYSAKPQEKAEDIHEMYSDKDVKLIFSVSGGFNSNSVFEYLDYELIKRNPKPLCGFSDSTSIENIIYNKTGVITFNGATFKSLTTWATPYAYEEVIKRFMNGDMRLGQEGDEYYTVKEGIAEGVLVGGNLGLVSELSAGKYSIDFTDKILFIEEFCLESPPEAISNYLYNLKQNGVFDKIKGVWVGNYEGSVPLEKILLDVLEDDYDFPIIKSNNFGHTEKKTVIPVGGKAKIDTSKDMKIEIIENFMD